MSLYAYGRIPNLKFRDENSSPRLYENRRKKKVPKMNLKQNNSKRTKLIAVVIVAVIASTMMIGFISQNLHNAMALANQPTSKNTQPSPVSINASSTKVINPSKSTDKEFWINTVHLDGMTNIHAANEM